ncbi:Agamous-like MADS-box protein tm6 [Dionaea muscipula]
MGRGKIEIKKIENKTNRQVTYSKRRNGIFKKAEELTVLCDAKVSLIILSSSQKLHEYISPSTDTKKMYDEYQKVLGVDIWRSHYEKMQENLRRLKEINTNLRREISRRMGGELDDLSIGELCRLHTDIADTVDHVRKRKLHAIKNQTNTCKKKVKNLGSIHRSLLLNLESKFCVLEHEGDYESAVAYTNGAADLFNFSLHAHRPSPQQGVYADHDLRLA